MLKNFLLSSIIILIAVCGFSQTQILRGKVINEKTKEALPFVNIAFKGTNQGTSSDIDGRFSITTEGNSEELVFSYVGYESFSYFIKPNQKNLIISLKEKLTELNEVIIRPEDNPALKIIQKAIRNKELNNPEKLSSFSYNSYNKLYSTLIDPEENLKKRKVKDTVAVNKFIENNHLFLIESYTERKFVNPNFSKETVLGNRMSGIKDPFFSFLATDFQPFSFYNEFIVFFNKNYLNPISDGSSKKYDFTLIDTVFHESDSVFVITFEPLPATSFAALKGQLYISSDGYAIEHVLAEVADDGALIEPHILQKYQKIDGHWFPVQLNSELHFKEYNVANHNLVYVSRSYLSNVRISNEINKKEFGLLNVEFDQEANYHKEEYWEQHRYDTLSKKEKNTYHLYDSISNKLRAFNSMMKLMEGLMVGKFKAGKFYLPTEHLIGFNDYEDNRIGLGLQTGERISKLASLEGYFAYGTRDKATKYGGVFQLHINQSKDAFLKFSYRQDVYEPGKANFMKGLGAINGEEVLRNWLIARMDSVEQYRAEVGFRPLRFTQLNLYTQQQKRNPTYAYSFLPDNDVTRSKNNFTITEIGLQARFSFKESYTQIGQSKVVTNLAYPQINISLSKSFSGLLNGDYEFSKAEIKVDQQFITKALGKTTVQIASGISKGLIPYPYLFNGKGAETTSNFNSLFLVPNYFQTMGLYEFASDRYAYLFFNHNFGRLTGTKSKYFRPELSVAQNIGVGSLQNKSYHKGIDINTMEKGYYESGLILNDLLRFKYVHLFYYGLGVGAFYRYGNYALPKTSDNLVFKLTVTASF